MNLNRNLITLFLLNPFSVFLYAIYNLTTKWAANAIWAFVAFFGFSFALGEETQGSDINRYISLLEYYHLHVDSFYEAVDYFRSSGDIDFMKYLISYVISRFTDSQAILTLVYGLIFGYFYSRNVVYFASFLKGKFNAFFWLFTLIFILIVPFWAINGFRFWTATQVFLYGLINFLIERNRKGLIYCFLSLVFHFAYLFPLLILLIQYLFPKKIVLALVFFITSFLVGELNVNWLGIQIERYAPTVFIERTDSYLVADIIERRGKAIQKLNWYVILHEKLLHYSISFLLVGFTLFFIKRKELFTYQNLLHFVLLFYGATNIVASFASGGRFKLLAIQAALLAMAGGLHIFSRQNTGKGLLWLSISGTLLFIIVSLREGLYFMSLTTVLGNPIIAFFTAGENISINDIIKGL